MSIRNYIAVLAFTGMFSAAQAGEWTCVGSTFTPDEASPAAMAGPTVLANAKLQFAVNEHYVAHSHVLSNGDELAIFTAVSGG